MTISVPPRRAIFYIDGFNLYYGAVKDTPFKWLNLEAFCRCLHPRDDLRRVRYFTSLVVGPTQKNQHQFLRALSTTPIVEVRQGRFKDKTVECKHFSCGFTGDRRFQSLEEKRTDVGIAVAMVDDAYQDLCDNLILLSGDSDLVPAVELIKQRFAQKKVFVYVPSRSGADERRASELMKAAHFARAMPTKHFKDCQFPQALKDKYGRDVVKPPTWK